MTRPTKELHLLREAVFWERVGREVMKWRIRMICNIMLDGLLQRVHDISLTIGETPSEKRACNENATCA